MNKKCKIKVNGAEHDGFLYGVFQVSQIIPPSLIQGGHNGGVVSQPVAIVDYGQGLTQVNVSCVYDIEE